MAILEMRMADAAREGRAAAISGKARSTNPHNLSADTAVERVLGKMWARGWDDGNPMPLLDDNDTSGEPATS